MRGKKHRWKMVALLAAGMAIGVTMTATPAVGHVSGWVHNWNRHIKPRTDARYYTKTAAEARYYNVGEIPANATNANALDGYDSGDFVRSIRYVRVSEAVASGGGTNSVTASCAADERVLGGGAYVSSYQVDLVTSNPWSTTGGVDGVPNSWLAAAQNNAGTSETIYSFAICGKTGTVVGTYRPAAQLGRNAPGID